LEPSQTVEKAAGIRAANPEALGEDAAKAPLCSCNCGAARTTFWQTGALATPNRPKFFEKLETIMESITTTRAPRNETGDAVPTAFTSEHLEGALKLSQEMSWPYRLEDWAFAMMVGQGFVITRSGEVIGTAAWFPNGDAFATIGMIIVSRKAQGHGFGARLVDALLSAVGTRTVLLNSTAEGRPLYERRSFQPLGIIHQHQGIPKGRHQAPPSDLVRPMQSSDFDIVARLDRQATGSERRTLLRLLVEAGEAQVLLRDGAVVGYVISRLFGRGHVVGPVVAETTTEARLLIEAALARLEGRLVRIDTAATSEVSPWLDEIGLSQVSDALTMVRGALPPTGPTRVFALSNQSFN
jgi:ribosomal protein S18 acetylase RimI-like enzyme